MVGFSGWAVQDARPLFRLSKICDYLADKFCALMLSEVMDWVQGQSERIAELIPDLGIAEDLCALTVDRASPSRHPNAPTTLEWTATGIRRNIPEKPRRSAHPPPRRNLLRRSSPRS